MLAPITHILALTNTRRTRKLDFPGQVLVRVGQKVNATDVIAQAQIPTKHLVLDIRRGLGLSRVSEAERSIIRQQGDRLEKGDVIAETGGLFSRIVRAPVDGEVVAVFGGQVLLRVGTGLSEVQAGMLGTVVELVNEYGAVIEANGALVQGMWGNGQADNGLLMLVARSPDDELTSQGVDVSMRGAVVLGGHCASADALRAGGDLPLRGLILSSLSAELIPLANSLPYPILVIEGFGKIPYNQKAFDLLSTSEMRDVSINGASDPQLGERPELIIPLPAAGQVAPEIDFFTPGQIVRIQGAPYTGKTGSVVQIRPGYFSLPNGLKALTADVQIDRDIRVTVPLANLEVIE
jgi:hypothetical protein